MVDRSSHVYSACRLYVERTMFFGVVLSVLLDVGHPRGVCLWIDGRDDDNGGARSDCDLG